MGTGWVLGIARQGVLHVLQQALGDNPGLLVLGVLVVAERVYFWGCQLICI